MNSDKVTRDRNIDNDYDVHICIYRDESFNFLKYFKLLGCHAACPLHDKVLYFACFFAPDPGHFDAYSLVLAKLMD